MLLVIVTSGMAYRADQLEKKIDELSVKLEAKTDLQSLRESLLRTIDLMECVTEAQLGSNGNLYRYEQDVHTGISQLMTVSELKDEAIRLMEIYLARYCQDHEIKSYEDIEDPILRQVARR
jgi:hypothetical protein